MLEWGEAIASPLFLSGLYAHVKYQMVITKILGERIEYLRSIYSNNAYFKEHVALRFFI